MALFSPIRFAPDGTFYVSGQLPSDMTAGLKEQAESSLRNMVNVLEDNGIDPQSILQVTLYTTQIEELATINEAYANVFTWEELPTRSALGVTGLAQGALFEADCKGWAPRG